MSQFCRHNRFISECPICAKGTVLDAGHSPERRPRSASSRTTTTARSQGGRVGARQSRGPYVTAGPYGSREVRLEKVPGGLRLASWLGGQMERSAPVLALADLPDLVSAATGKEIFGAAEAEKLRDAFAASGFALGDGDGVPDAPAAAPTPSFGRSPGRSGDFKEELRVEVFDDGLMRVARWLMRPNRGWELQEAPVMLPPARFAQALADAAKRGVLAAVQPTA